MDAIRYRFATQADIPALVALRLSFLAETDPPNPPDPAALRQAIEYYFNAAIPAGEFVAAVAVHNDTLIATSGMVFWRRPPRTRSLVGRDAYIMNMYTLPEFRRRGVASVLLQMLIDHARQADCRHVSLHTAPNARALYTKLGFQTEDSMMGLRL